MSNPARTAFLTAFSKVTGTGNFHSTGSVPFFLPGIGIGIEAGTSEELAFPLPKSQVEILIPFAEAAPYGRGEATLHDDSVRKCWQIGASSISITTPQWRKFLASTLDNVRSDLGITGKISAHLYKLLIYGRGGHFKPHRDTEKLDAMFGTLIVALPSAHTGGQLFVRHNGREVELDFSGEQSRQQFQYAAFFADCEHEVKPVRSGYRCCLVYNLRLDKGDPRQLNLPLDGHARSLLPSLNRLKQERASQLSAVLLEHSYTEANLSLANLKGNDQARGRALLAAAKEARYTAHLALVTYYQLGELEDAYIPHSGRSSRFYDDEPIDGTMGEIYDETLSIGTWRNANDRRVQLGEYPIDKDDIISLEPFGEGEPDEEEAEGFTGNAGCTMTHWYRRAAIVLWADEDHEAIMCKYNFEGACSSLVKLAAATNTGPGSRFHNLARPVVAGLADRYQESESDHRRFNRPHESLYNTLAALAKAGADDLLRELLRKLPATALSACDHALWKNLFEAFGVDRFDPVFKELRFTADGPLRRQLLVQLLPPLISLKDGRARVASIAAQLARLDPVEPDKVSRRKSGDSRSTGASSECRALLLASHLLTGKKDRMAALDFIKGDQSLRHVRETLAPVLLDATVQKCLQLPDSLVPEALAFAVDLLAAEVANPVEAYPDWRRPFPDQPTDSGVGIQELAAFMRDPGARSHHFVFNKAERERLENFIKWNSLDLDSETITVRRPYTLACTKNHNSLKRRRRQHATDRELLKKLKKL